MVRILDIGYDSCNDMIVCIIHDEETDIKRVVNIKIQTIVTYGELLNYCYKINKMCNEIYSNFPWNHIQCQNIVFNCNKDDVIANVKVRLNNSTKKSNIIINSTDTGEIIVNKYNNAIANLNVKNRSEIMEDFVRSIKSII